MRARILAALAFVLLPTLAPAAAGAVPADLYLPSASGPRPVAVIGHAYLTDAERYAWLAAALAEDGWIVTVPRTAMTWAADPDSFAADLAAACAEVRAAGQDPASPLFGRVGGRAVVVGHSLGGAAAVRAAGSGAFAALVTLAVLDGGDPPTRRRAAAVQVPTLMVAVAGDCVTPPEVHEFPVWDRLGTPEALGVLLDAGTHCGFAAPDADCSGAEWACGTPAADGAVQQGRVLDVLLPWLAAVLDGDAAARAALQAELEGAGDLAWRGGGQVAAPGAGWGGLHGLYR